MDTDKQKAQACLVTVASELMHAMNNVTTSSRAHDILLEVAVMVQQSQMDLIQGA